MVNSQGNPPSDDVNVTARKESISLLERMGIDWPIFRQELEGAAQEGHYNGCLLTFEDGALVIGQVTKKRQETTEGVEAAVPVHRRGYTTT